MSGFYGQHGEDCLLWTFFKGKADGFYVDVGAFDGRHVSNTYAFELRGWRGICLEPHPITFGLLRELRTAICLNLACVSDETTASVTFYTEPLGLLSGIQGDREDDVRRRYERRGLQFDGFESITVPAMTLNQILVAHLPVNTPIDFISIDVEGTELAVLQGLDLQRYPARVLVIETNTPADRETMKAYLTTKGYHFARRRGVNDFYVRDLTDVDRLRGIAIDCQIEGTPHPFGEAYNTETLANGYRVTVPAEIPSDAAASLPARIKQWLKDRLK